MKPNNLQNKTKNLKETKAIFKNRNPSNETMEHSVKDKHKFSLNTW